MKLTDKEGEMYWDMLDLQVMPDILGDFLEDDFWKNQKNLKSVQWKDIPSRYKPKIKERIAAEL